VGRPSWGVAPHRPHLGLCDTRGRPGDRTGRLRGQGEKGWRLNNLREPDSSVFEGRVALDEW